MLDIPTTMTRLSAMRPIFHSEADFQHALAWDIHEHHEADIRLEFRPPLLKEHVYIDIWIQEPTLTTAIEVKYKTRRLSADVKGEPFDLLNQAAQDLGRYDVMWDVHRLEHVVWTYPSVAAFVLFLTNDSSYWTAGTKADSFDAAFRLHEGRQVKGPLTWARGTGVGTMKGRADAIELFGCYECRWQDYSTVSGAAFRYLLIPVPAQTA